MKDQSLNDVKIVLCSYCNTDPGLKPGSETIWNGFFDKDTNQNVCWKCKRNHYAVKFMNSGTKGLYSEFSIQYNFKHLTCRRIKMVTKILNMKGILVSCVATVLVVSWISVDRPDPKVVTLINELGVLKSIESQDEVTEGLERKAKIKKIENEIATFRNVSISIGNNQYRNKIDY